MAKTHTEVAAVSCGEDRITLSPWEPDSFLPLAPPVEPRGPSTQQSGATGRWPQARQAERLGGASVGETATSQAH